MTCTNVASLNNLADVLTHSLSYEDGTRHFKKFNLLQNTTLNQTSAGPLVGGRISASVRFLL